MTNSKPTYKTIKDPVSDEAMERLVQIMTDSPSLLKLKDTEWEITALKPGIMWLIAKEAAQINKVEKATFSDVLQGLSINMPSVCRILTLALLNNKNHIKSGDPEYDKVYDALFWECEDMKDWATILFEVLNLLSVEFFFAITELTQTFRQMTLERKTKMEERKQSSQEQVTGKCLIL